MTYTLFNQKFEYSVTEVVSWFHIYLMFSFQDITQNMFCILAKISHSPDLEIYYFDLEHAIELHCILMTRYVSIARYVTKNSIIRHISASSHRKTRYGEKPHKPTVFGCYVDLAGFVMSE